MAATHWKRTIVATVVAEPGARGRAHEWLGTLFLWLN